MPGGQGNFLGVEGIGLYDIGAGLEVLAVDIENDLGLGENQEVVIAFEIRFPVFKAIAPVIRFRQFMPLNHGSHSPIDDEDAFFQYFFNVGHKSCKFTIIQAAIVFEIYGTVLLVFIEKVFQCGYHIKIFFGIGGGDIGGRIEAAFETLKIEDLGVIENFLLPVSFTEKIIHYRIIHPAVINQIVIGPEFLEEVFIFFKKWGSVFAVVPGEEYKASGFEYAFEFRFGFFPVEPVKSLSGEDVVNALPGQGSIFGGGIEGGEAGKRFEAFFGGLAHGGAILTRPRGAPRCAWGYWVRCGLRGGFF